MDDFDSLIACGVFVANCSGFIRGTVIYQNDFQVLIGLGYYA